MSIETAPAQPSSFHANLIFCDSVVVFVGLAHGIRAYNPLATGEFYMPNKGPDAHFARLKAALYILAFGLVCAISVIAILIVLVKYYVICQ